MSKEKKFNFKFKLKKSITSKVIRLIATMIIPINIISLVFLWLDYRGNQKVVQGEINSSVEVAAEGLSKELVSMRKRLLLETVENTSLVELANRYDSLSTDRRYECVSNVTDFLDKTRGVQNNIDVVFYYFPENSLFLKSGSVGALVGDYIDTIIEAYDNVEDSNYICTSFDANDTPIFIYMGRYRSVGYGYILQLNSAAKRLTAIDGDDENRTFFLGNGDGTLLSRGGNNFLKEHNMSFSNLKNSGQYYLASAQIGKTNLYIYEVVPYSEIDGSIGIPLRILLIIFALYIIVAIPIIIVSIRKWMLKPLEKLSHGIEVIESGDTEYRLDENVSGEEFRHIHRNFNNMMDEISDMRIDIYEKELEKNQIRMDYLSHQIQPHFVLNALNILYSYEPEEYELSQKMILCISKYFRHIVYANDKYVTLKSEMEHIENYFEIQKARYPDLFYSWVEYDPELRDALLPPLLIQNFAENAIKHSLKIGNRITIFVIAEKIAGTKGYDLVRIRLADTGEGIPDYILDEIQAFKDTGIRQEHLNVGMHNSIERLKVLYGDVAELNIGRDANYQGTNVELIIPFARQGVNNDKEQWS